MQHEITADSSEPQREPAGKAGQAAGRGGGISPAGRHDRGRSRAGSDGSGPIPQQTADEEFNLAADGTFVSEWEYLLVSARKR